MNDRFSDHNFLLGEEVNDLNQKSKKRWCWCLCKKKKLNTYENISDSRNWENSPKRYTFQKIYNRFSQEVNFEDLVNFIHEDGQKPQWQKDMRDRFLNLYKEKNMFWIETTLEFLNDYTGPIRFTYNKNQKNKIYNNIQEAKQKELSVFDLRNSKFPVIDQLEFSDFKQRKSGFKRTLTKTVVKIEKPVFQKDISVGQPQPLRKSDFKFSLNRMNSDLDSLNSEKRMRKPAGSTINPEMLKEGQESMETIMNSRMCIGKVKEFDKDVILKSDYSDKQTSIENENLYNYVKYERKSTQNREKESMMIQEKEIIKRVKKCINIFQDLQKVKTSFFYNLQKKIIQSFYLDFRKSLRIIEMHNDKEGVQIILENLFSNLITYAQEISLGVFDMFEDNNLIYSGDEGDLQKSDVLISCVLSFAFSRNIISVPDLKSKNGYKYKNLHDLVLPVILKQHYSSIYYFKIGLNKVIEGIVDLDDLHPVLKLDEKSLNFMDDLLRSGNKKIPEFFVNVSQLHKKSARSLERFKEEETADPKLVSYENSINALKSIQKERSPYLKLFYFLKCIKSISEDIDYFYTFNGYKASIVLTAEELFPIIIFLMSKAKTYEILGDLILTWEFANEELKIGEVGHCLNTFFAAHEYISFIGKNKNS